MRKTLSIIVPSYNMEKYLPKCLGSLVVAPELMDRLEVLVVNDGSKDRTSEIAHEFAAKWPETFKVIDKPNGNYGSCINAALPVATGKYVKVLDADDWFEKSGFEKFIRCLEGCVDDEVDLVLSDYDVVDEHGEISEHHVLPFLPLREFDSAEFLKSSAYVPMHAYTYRTDVLRQIHYVQLEGVSYTDTEWILLPLLAVDRVIRIPHVVYKYLRGRVGQTMAEDVKAVNFCRVMGLIALDLIEKMDGIMCEQKAEIVGLVRERVFAIIADVYRRGIFGAKKYKCYASLNEFDERLKTLDPATYDKVGLVEYSRKLKYRYVSAWRGGTRTLPLMILICKLYANALHVLSSAGIRR